MNNCAIMLLLTVLLVPVSGCADYERQPADEMTSQDFEQLVISGYIEPYKTGDTEHWMEIFADGAVGMHNTLPALEGKQAIRQFAEVVHSSFDIEQLDVTVDSVTREGDWALTRGNFTASFIHKDGGADIQTEPRQGKYVLLWERQNDGSWKVILDMGNSNSP